jgi:hypothetical protein
MLFNTLALISLLVMMMILRTLVEVFPSLMACLIRSKESINLEASVQLSRSRTVLAVCLIVPFCLLVWQRGLYTPAFMEGYGDNIGLGITFGVFLAYLLTRKIMEFIIRRKVRNSKTYEAACKAGLTFFSILTLVLLATGGIMSVLDTPADVVKSAMLWISACIYLIFILRKTQILISSASFFAAFLYLCALELIPTGALAASAIIF